MEVVVGAFNKEKVVEEGLLRALWNMNLFEGWFAALFPSQVSSSQYDAALTLSQISCAARELLQSITHNSKTSITQLHFIMEIEISPQYKNIWNLSVYACELRSVARTH